MSLFDRLKRREAERLKGGAAAPETVRVDEVKDVPVAEPKIEVQTNVVINNTISVKGEDEVKDILTEPILNESTVTEVAVADVTKEESIGILESTYDVAEISSEEHDEKNDTFHESTSDVTGISPEGHEEEDNTFPENTVIDELPSDGISEAEIEETLDSTKYRPSEWEKVGVIYGNVGTNSFDCRVCSRLERSEYVMVKHEDYGYILCQVGSLIRKTNVTLEKSLNYIPDNEIEDVISAHIDVIGYRDSNNLLLTPRTTFKARTDVLRADKELVKKVLGLKMNLRTNAYIGLLHGHDLPVSLNINDLLQRHACILAKTGGGKSYMSGDIIEELMKHNVTCMIIDPHGEYGAMREMGHPGNEKFNVVPRGFSDRIKEFKISPEECDNNVKQLRFTFNTLQSREILELTKAKDLRMFLPPTNKALDNLRASSRFYSVRDLIDELKANSEENKNAVLINELEYIDSMNVFSAKGNPVSELVEKGKTSIINLKGVPPDIQSLIVKRLATVLFEMRKRGTIPPMMFVVEEAHNYCPQVGTVMSSEALATIASEGRKFGLGLMVISQRPAKIDKNVLSQCGTQIILKVTNPNDIKAITQSIEGLTNGMADDIPTMPVGMAMVVGAGIESPLLVEVRPRQSRHGGAGVKVLEDTE